MGALTPIVPALPSSSRMAMSPVPNLVRRMAHDISSDSARSTTSTRWNGQLRHSRGQSGSGRVIPALPLVTAVHSMATNCTRKRNAIVMITNDGPRER